MSVVALQGAGSVLIIEDDEDFRESLAALVRNEGFRVREAEDLAAARRALAEETPDIVLLDLVLPDGSGLDLKFSAAITPETPFIVVTGDASGAAARSALRGGALDYVTKPIDPPALTAVLRGALRSRALASHVRGLRQTLRDAGRFGRLVGRSPAMQRVYDLIARVAPTSAPVLVTGESGTGKELVARTLHEMSPRADGPFIDVNCGAIPETLIESRLFGHEKGAFTGADERARGIFEEADGGTLFLDEIGEMPLALQVRLLRVLESGSFTRVGGVEVVQSDVRVLAATNRDPRTAVTEGKLRDDLYHRLNVFPIHLPRLRDRGDDAVLLAQHFLEEVNRKEGTEKYLHADTAPRIREASWPGNARELKNVIQRAWILSGATISADAIALDAECTGIATPSTDGGNSAAYAPDVLAIPLGSTLAEVERRLVVATLAWCGGNKRKTARALGVSVKTVYNRLSVYASPDRPGS